MANPGCSSSAFPPIGSPLACIIEKGHINQPLQTALLNAARRSVQGVSDQYLGI
jgi:hypothetical protein